MVDFLLGALVGGLCIGLFIAIVAIKDIKDLEQYNEELEDYICEWCQ